MASSKKTSFLKLNAWEANDKPKRSDFVSDNSIIDQNLGGHIHNSSTHLTSTEKARTMSPYYSFGYAGTGKATETITLDFSPLVVYMYRKNKPFTTHDSKGNTIVNSGMVVSNYLGGSSGISLNDNKITVTQNSSPVNGEQICLNELYGQYVIVAFR